MTDQHLLPNRWPTLEELEAATKYVPEIDPLAIFSINELLVAAREIEVALDRDLGRYGLSLSRYATLWIIAGRKEKGITPAEIAESLGVTRATMTGVLDGLQKDGLIERRQRADDRRKIDIVSTEKARRMLANLYPDHIARVVQANPLSDQERKTLCKLLKKLVSGTPALLEDDVLPPLHPSKVAVAETLGVKLSKRKTTG